MPIYDYRCPVCGWAGDRNVKYDERDTQRCGRTATDIQRDAERARLDKDRLLVIAHPSWWDAYQAPGRGALVGVDLAAGAVGTATDADTPCPGTLQRDEIAVNARMLHQWRP